MRKEHNIQPSLPRLIAAWKLAKSDPTVVFNTGVWSDLHWTAERFRRWVWECLNNKINAKDAGYPAGRKAMNEYHTELGRLRAYVGNRIVIDWIAPCLGARVREALGYRLRSNVGDK